MDKKELAKATAVLKKFQALLSHPTEISTHYGALTLIPLGLNEHQKTSGHRKILSCAYDHTYQVTVENYRTNDRLQSFTSMDESGFNFLKIAARINHVLTLKNQALAAENAKRSVMSEKISDVNLLADKFGVVFSPRPEPKNPVELSAECSRIDYTTYNIEKHFEFTVVCMTLEEVASFLKAYANRSPVSQDESDCLTERNMPSNVVTFAPRRTSDDDSA